MGAVLDACLPVGRIDRRRRRAAARRTGERAVKVQAGVGRL